MTVLRPPTEDDAPEVARLMSEHAPERVDVSEVANGWTWPSVDPRHDGRVGEGVYVFVEDLGDERAWIDLKGKPVPEALEWAEARVVEKGGRRALTGGWSTDHDLFAALEARGYRRVRSSWRMYAPLGAQLPRLAATEGVEIRSLGPGEEQLAYEVHQEAFEDTWEPIRWSFEEWAHAYVEPSSFDPGLWLLAWSGDEPCGVAICHVHATDPALGWIAVLGVRRAWRRRGIARALLAHAFARFAERGLTRAGLGVDAESPTGANELYEDAGMSAASRFDLYERALA
jgi:ribosomal protein S18 acetylase RimI-like enzyme